MEDTTKNAKVEITELEILRSEFRPFSQRDKIAIKAMQAMLNGRASFSSSLIAMDSYIMADAMLKARAENPNKTGEEK